MNMNSARNTLFRDRFTQRDNLSGCTSLLVSKNSIPRFSRIQTIFRDRFTQRDNLSGCTSLLVSKNSIPRFSTVSRILKNETGVSG